MQWRCSRCCWWSDKGYHDRQLQHYLSFTGDYDSVKIAFDAARLDGMKRYCVAVEQVDKVKSRRRHALRLKSATKLRTYIEDHRDRTLLISVSDEASRKLSKATRAYMDGRGASVGGLEYRGSYVALWHHGRCLADVVDNVSAVSLRWNRGDVVGGLELVEPIVLLSGGRKSRGRSSIMVGGTERSPAGRGMRVVVLDKDLRFIDAVVFDTYRGGSAVEVFWAVRSASP